eukprot:NODE_3_length_80033_cov_0.932970.p1 type:complete len:1374 gc:universal NODE_3_length_80033_cov_0.932970:33967-29846(-)
MILEEKAKYQLELHSILEKIHSLEIHSPTIIECLNSQNWNHLVEIVGFENIEFVESLQRRRLDLIPIFYNKSLVMSAHEFVSNESETTKQYPHIYADSERKFLDWAGHKFSLPASSIFIEEDLYKEIVIPPPKIKLPKTDLIRVNDCDTIIQSIFTHIQAFNQMQSIIFNTAYNTKENILLSAPTSAGKTNVALLVIANAIKETPKHLTKSLKMVYVAPMKALVAEITTKFKKILRKINITVNEVSGDMQLSRKELMNTNLLVSTPEKLDVITRKMHGDDSFMANLKLLILDEIHLLSSERGSVLECLVARIQRHVELKQSLIRILGLSATLPNYFDVANFIQVNPNGLFVFDSNWRPVPLHQSIIGNNYKSNDPKSRETITKIVFEKIVPFLKDDKQVMVFVHSRNETLRVARSLKRMADISDSEIFQLASDYGYVNELKKLTSKSFNDLLQHGIAVHHAGLVRSDRNNVEKWFLKGYCRLLVCTATLAWGVNLPSSVVVIHGTSIYDPSKSDFIDLSILDVNQIFGRAGRPQFENKGYGILVTSSDKYRHYVEQLSLSLPIESQFTKHLSDYINAEVALGTITTLDDAMIWLGYTFQHVRCFKNPIAYGSSWKDLAEDTKLISFRRSLAEKALLKLNRREMILYDQKKELVESTHLGKIASHFYISAETIETFNQGKIGPLMNIDKVFQAVCLSNEFEQLKVRDDELQELDMLLSNCPLEIQGTSADSHCKANVLLQTYVNKKALKSFSLMSDQFYVVENAKRICRAIFEISKYRTWTLATKSALTSCIIIENRSWPFQHPIIRYIPSIRVADQLNDLHLYSMEEIRECDCNYLSKNIMDKNLLEKICNAVDRHPNFSFQYRFKPLLSSVITILINVIPHYSISRKSVEQFHIFVHDSENIVFSQQFAVSNINCYKPIWQEFTVLISEPVQKGLKVLIMSNDFHYEDSHYIDFQDLIIPKDRKSISNLKNLTPYFEPQDNLFFNPIETQVLFEVIHSRSNVFVGCSVYFDFSNLILSIVKNCKKKIFVLVHKEYDALQSTVSSLPNTDVQLGTSSDFIRKIDNNFQILIVNNFINLKSIDFEIIKCKYKGKLIVLGPTLGNSGCIKNWLNIPDENCFNFRQDLLPSPILENFQGFSEKYYPARMSNMMRSIYSKIKFYDGNVIIFVPSRKQIKTTFSDIISFLSQENPHKFVYNPDIAILSVEIKDETIKHCLSFGIGLLHPLMTMADIQVIQNLFKSNQIGLLVATIEMNNLDIKTNLVIIKGCGSESKAYEIKDLLNLIAFSLKDVMILCKSDELEFLQHELNSPFILESSLDLFEFLQSLSRTRKFTKKQIIDVAESTLLYVRMQNNPQYYEQKWSDLIELCISRLAQ